MQASLPEDPQRRSQMTVAPFDTAGPPASGRSDGEAASPQQFAAA